MECLLPNGVSVFRVPIAHFPVTERRRPDLDGAVVAGRRYGSAAGAKATALTREEWPLSSREDLAGVRVQQSDRSIAARGCERFTIRRITKAPYRGSAHSHERPIFPRACVPDSHITSFVARRKESAVGRERE